jgi:hypothetical protein
MLTRGAIDTEGHDDTCIEMRGEGRTFILTGVAKARHGKNVLSRHRNPTHSAIPKRVLLFQGRQSSANSALFNRLEIARAGAKLLMYNAGAAR